MAKETNKKDCKNIEKMIKSIHYQRNSQKTLMERLRLTWAC